MLIQTNGPLRSLLALMLPCLAKTRKEEKDERVISLGLHIIRNLLSVKDAVASDTTTGQKEEMSRMQVSSRSLEKERADGQSNLISQLYKLTYFQLFLTLASLAEQTQINQYNVLILDILHLVYRGVRPKDLVRDQARVCFTLETLELKLISRDLWINWLHCWKASERRKRSARRIYQHGIHVSAQPSRFRL